MSLTTNGFDQPLGPLVHGWTPPAFPVPLKMQGSYCTVEPFDPDAHGSALFDALSEIQSDWTYLPCSLFLRPRFVAVLDPNGVSWRPSAGLYVRSGQSLESNSVRQ